MRISRVETVRCTAGEGPIWDHAGQVLYFLDVIGRNVHRYDPASGKTQSWATPSHVGSLALRDGGGLLVALTGGIYTLDLMSGTFELTAKIDADPERTLFNDGKVDRRGRYLVGLSDMDFNAVQPAGGLYSLGQERKLRLLDSGISLSNGPCWSPDNKIFYFSDSHRKTTYAYDYDIETGVVAGRRALIDTSELDGEPDGATVDRDGLIWMGIFRGGKIVAFRPDGRVERVVNMPVPMAVSLTFGGPDLDVLYVTTINPTFLNEPANDEAGYIYRIEGLGVRGLPEPRFAG